MAFKFAPSSLTYATIFFLKSYWSNNSIKFLAITCHVVLFASNNLIMICWGYHSSFKKLITNAKTSCAPFDIHKSIYTCVAWLLLVRVVRCWVKSYNKCNPCFVLLRHVLWIKRSIINYLRLTETTPLKRIP